MLSASDSSSASRAMLSASASSMPTAPSDVTASDRPPHPGWPEAASAARTSASASAPSTSSATRFLEGIFGTGTSGARFTGRSSPRLRRSSSAGLRLFSATGAGAESSPKSRMHPVRRARRRGCASHASTSARDARAIRSACLTCWRSTEDEPRHDSAPSAWADRTRVRSSASSAAQRATRVGPRPAASRARSSIASVASHKLKMTEAQRARHWAPRGLAAAAEISAAAAPW